MKRISARSRSGWTGSSPERILPLEGEELSALTPSAIFEVLIDRGEDCAFLPADIRDAYGGDLSLPAPPPNRPAVISNFVASLDGQVTFGGQGGSEARLISRRSQDDHWLMGLLRASADAVIVGASTLRSDLRHTWAARALRGADADRLEKWRSGQGKPPNPIQCFVTASGSINPEAEVFQQAGLQPVVFTTEEGAIRLRLPGRTAIRAVRDSEGAGVDLGDALRILRSEFGVELALCEGGPSLFATLLDLDLVDEMFQTVSPVVVGADPAIEGRLGLTRGAAWAPATAPVFDLISARTGKRDRDHLFLRYRRRHLQA